jgi:hypothetical protein
LTVSSPTRSRSARAEGSGFAQRGRPSARSAADADIGTKRHLPFLPRLTLSTTWSRSTVLVVAPKRFAQEWPGDCDRAQRVDVVLRLDRRRHSREWRRTSLTSSSGAPLRSMSVARLWRRRCEPTYFCGGFRPVLRNASSSTAFTICPFLNGLWWGVLADTNRARETPARPFLIIHDRFAHLCGKRHAIMQLALAADEDLAGQSISSSWMAMTSGARSPSRSMSTSAAQPVAYRTLDSRRQTESLSVNNTPPRRSRQGYRTSFAPPSNVKCEERQNRIMPIFRAACARPTKVSLTNSA